MDRKWILAAVLALGLLAVTATLVLSQSGIDPRTGFGPDFLLSLPLDHQDEPSVVYNADDDEYLVVWSDERADDGDIYGQRFSAGGVPRGDNLVLCAAAGKQSDPHVAYNPDNDNYMVVWSDQRLSSAYDVYGQVINASGVLSGSDFAINTDTGDQTPGDLVYDPNASHYLVVWVDVAQDRVEGQLLDPAGALLPPNAFVISTPGGDDPRAAYDSDRDSYMIVYEDSGDIYAQPIAADGSLPSSAIVVCSHAADQSYPDLEFNATTHQYLVAWQDIRNAATTGADVYARRIDQDGNPLGTSETIVSSAADAQGEPAVAYNARVNQWLVTWEDYRNRSTGGLDVYGQQVLPTGALAGQGNLAIYNGPSDQGHVALAARPAQTGAEYLVVWEDQRGGQGEEIAGQRVGAAQGTLNWHPFSISAPLGSQEDPDVVYNPNAQHFFVVWQDSRENEWDIYGHIVLTTGLPITDNIVVRDEAHALVAPVVAHSTVSNTYLVAWEDQDEGDVEARVVNADGSLGTAFNVFDAVAITQPAIAYNSAANEYLVVFVYQDSPTNQDIYGRRVLANGTVSGAAFPICSNADDQVAPHIVYNATDDEYLVVWYDERNLAATGWDIYGQRVTASGSVTVTGAAIAVSTASGDQYDPVVDWDEARNEYLVVWRDGRNFATAGYDIYGQRLSGAGVPLGEVPVVTASGTQTAPHVNYISTLGRYVVTWADDRNAATSGWDLYGQNVNPDGSLYLGTIPFLVFTGDQQRPAGDFSPQANRGLTTWQDNRNGATYKIYGRLKEPRFSVYLPLVLQNYQ